MIVVPALLSLLVTLFCLLARPTRDEAEQAALLPFADDPPAAHRLERDTGLRCATCSRYLVSMRRPLSMGSWQPS